MEYSYVHRRNSHIYGRLFCEFLPKEIQKVAILCFATFEQNSAIYDSEYDRLRKRPSDKFQEKITIEIRSLNSKGLDLNARIASVFREKELTIRKLVSTA